MIMPPTAAQVSSHTLTLDAAWTTTLTINFNVLDDSEQPPQRPAQLPALSAWKHTCPCVVAPSAAQKQSAKLPWQAVPLIWSSCTSWRQLSGVQGSLMGLLQAMLCASEPSVPSHLAACHHAYVCLCMSLYASQPCRSTH